MIRRVLTQDEAADQNKELDKKKKTRIETGFNDIIEKTVDNNLQFIYIR